jgi:hypothetical protein
MANEIQQPNVGFKRGTQERLDNLLVLGTGANAIPGTFYLTTDTNRLYIGKEDNSIAPVNAGIITVDQITADPQNNLTGLPAKSDSIVGNYYYAAKENILCIFNGQDWIQINSVVTNTDLSTDLSGDGTVTVTTTVEQTAGGTKTDSYTITGANGLHVKSTAPNAMQVGVETPITVTATGDANNKEASVSLASSLNKDEEDQGFKLKAGTNVDSIEVSDSDITINVKDTANTGLASTVEAASDGSKVNVTTTVTQAPGTAVSGSYGIKGGNGIGVTVDNKDLKIAAEQVKVNVASTTGGAAVTLKDSNLIDSSNKSFDIVSGNSNVTVAVEGSKIKISSTDTNTTVSEVASTLDTSNSVVTVSTTVSSTDGTPKTGSYKVTGANGINVSSDANGLMTVSADKIQMNVADVTGGASVTLGNSDMIDANQAFNIIGEGNNVTVDADGKNIKISVVDTKVTGVDLSNSATGGFDFALSQSPGKPLTTAIDPIIKIGKENSEASIHFINGVADLDVYTTGQTDTLIENNLKLFNSMTYRGTISNKGEIPTANIRVGDTYLLANDNVVDNYPSGTLMIARSTYDQNNGENEDGYIPIQPDNHLVWDYVTGSQVDTRYSFAVTEGGIQLIQNGTSAVGSIKAQGAAAKVTNDTNDIVVTSKNSDGADQVLEISHKAYSTSAGSATGDNSVTMNNNDSIDIIAVDSISTANGHVTGFTTKKFTVVDTNATLTSYTVTPSQAAEAKGKIASISQEIVLTPSRGTPQSKTASFSLESQNDNLHVNVSGASVQMNLVWDTF